MKTTTLTGAGEESGGGGGGGNTLVSRYRASPEFVRQTGRSQRAGVLYSARQVQVVIAKEKDAISSVPASSYTIVCKKRFSSITSA